MTYICIGVLFLLSYLLHVDLLKGFYGIALILNKSSPSFCGGFLALSLARLSLIVENCEKNLDPG